MGLVQRLRDFPNYGRVELFKILVRRGWESKQNFRTTSSEKLMIFKTATGTNTKLEPISCSIWGEDEEVAHALEAPTSMVQGMV